MAREILEPVDHDSGQYGVRVARNSSANRVGKEDGSKDRNKDRNEDENDIDHDSDTSDLPSLQDLLRQVDKDFGRSGDPSLKSSTPEDTFNRTRKEDCCEADSKNKANPAVSTAKSVQPGSSQGEQTRSRAAEHACTVFANVSF